MSKTILGYAEWGPYDGIGPFKSIFDEGKRLLYADNIDDCDAIVLWGGADISPSLYNEERILNSGPTDPSDRDLFEWELCRRAIERGIPLIGVCRGAQLLCAVAGGKLIQDVSGHHGPHSVTCHTGETFEISSCHHQMMYPYDIDHELLAWSSTKRSNHYAPSGTEMATYMSKPAFEEPEVVWFPEIKGFGVQCHPEWHGNYAGTAKDGTAFNKWMMEQIVSHCFAKEVC